MKPTVAVALLAFVSGLIAQERDADQRTAKMIEQLIEQLDEKSLHDSAFHQLVAMGEPAVRVIRSQIEGGEYSAARFRILGEIGPAALETFPLLFDTMIECPSESLGALFNAAYSLWVFLPEDEQAETLVRLGTKLTICIARNKVVGIPQDLVVVRARSLAYSWPPLISANSSMRTLVQALPERRVDDIHRSHLAALLLGRMGVKARPVLPDLLRMLMAPAPRRNLSLMGASGVTISRWQSPPSRKPYAQAILNIDANGAEAVDAYVYLIEHGDSHERHESVKSLGALGTASPLGISSLIRVATKRSEKTATRYEAITTLGMIGPLAAPAIFVLRTLTRHEDPQIAERAKAALRQIRITLDA